MLLYKLYYLTHTDCLSLSLSITHTQILLPFYIVLSFPIKMSDFFGGHLWHNLWEKQNKTHSKDHLAWFSKLQCLTYFLKKLFFLFRRNICLKQLSCPSLHEYGRAQSQFQHFTESLLPRMGGDSKGMGLLLTSVSHPAPSSPQNHVRFSLKLSQDSAPHLFFSFFKTWPVSGCNEG